MPDPSPDSLEKITTMLPNPAVTDAVVKGLAAHVDEPGKPLCPCNFYTGRALRHKAPSK
jgi:ferredoxin-thioredoxin reductase catalytic chain